MIADLSFLIVVKGCVDLRRGFGLAGIFLLLTKGRKTGGDFIDLIGGASLDRGMELRLQSVHLLAQTGSRDAVLLEGGVDGTLLGGVQTSSLGETGLGIQVRIRHRAGPG